MNITEARTTTGEDIGPITWPVMAAIHEPRQGALRWVVPSARNAVALCGRFESCRRGMLWTLDVTRDDAGRAVAVLELRMPSNEASQVHARTLRLLADVRSSWIDDIGGAAATRCEAGERLAAAVATLATLPGQHSVAVVEDGLGAADGIAALRAALAESRLAA